MVVAPFCAQHSRAPIAREPLGNDRDMTRRACKKTGCRDLCDHRSADAQRRLSRLGEGAVHNDGALQCSPAFAAIGTNFERVSLSVAGAALAAAASGDIMLSGGHSPVMSCGNSCSHHHSYWERQK